MFDKLNAELVTDNPTDCRDAAIKLQEMQKQLASGVTFHAGQVWAETYLAQRSFLPPTLVAGNSLIGSLAASSSGSQVGSIQEGRKDVTKMTGTSPSIWTHG